METKENKHLHKTRVHRILAHSYTTYFVLFLIGVYLDIFSKFKIFTNSTIVSVGIILLIFATFLILWAQKTGRDFNKVEHLKAEHFCRGPYCYTRSPTHWGLFFLMLGFGIIADAPFVIITTIISFLIAKFVFLDKEEAVLAEKYGSPYLEYKKIVKL